MELVPSFSVELSLLLSAHAFCKENWRYIGGEEVMSLALPKEVRYYLTPYDHQRVEAILAASPPLLQEPLLRSVHAAAVFDARSLSALLPLLGPILHALPAESLSVLLERIASLSRFFPAIVVPLFRSLGRVMD